MDPSETPIPAWAIEKLHKALDGEENGLGAPICWGQPGQDEEEHRKYWSGFMKFKGACVTWDAFAGPGAVICWAVCCPLATWWACEACCGSEYKQQLSWRIPNNMKIVWILYSNHMVYISGPSMKIFHLANISKVEATDNFEGHMRDGLLGCTQACFQGSREGIVVHGVSGDVDVANRVVNSPITMQHTVGSPGQYHLSGGMPSMTTVQVGLETFSRMMEDPYKFANAANAQIKDCQEARMVSKQPFPNEAVKDYAARIKAERERALTEKEDGICHQCGKMMGTGPFCKGCGLDRNAVATTSCKKCGATQTGGEFCEKCGTAMPPLGVEVDIAGQSATPVTTNTMHEGARDDPPSYAEHQAFDVQGSLR
jgi:hypothetical protein